MALTTIPQKPIYIGDAPNRLTQQQSEFSANADNMMGYLADEAVNQNAVTNATNTLAVEVEGIGVQVAADRVQTWNDVLSTFNNKVLAESAAEQAAISEANAEASAQLAIINGDASISAFESTGSAAIATFNSNGAAAIDNLTYAVGFGIVGDFADVTKVQITAANQAYTSQSILSLEDAVWRYTGALPYTPTGSDPTQAPELDKWQAVAIGELKSIARSLSRQDSDIGYGDAGLVVKPILYAKDQQVVYSVPATAIGKTISSVVDSTLHTTEPASYQLEPTAQNKEETDLRYDVNFANTTEMQVGFGIAFVEGMLLSTGGTSWRVETAGLLLLNGGLYANPVSDIFFRDFGAKEDNVTDDTTVVHSVIELVGAKSAFNGIGPGFKLCFTPFSKVYIAGGLLLPSYVNIDVNFSTIRGIGANALVTSAFFDNGVLTSNLNEPVETQFVVCAGFRNANLLNINRAFRLYNFCESSEVSNIRGVGCNQLVFAKRCFYSSFTKMHSRSPLDGAAFACYEFESAMGALEASQFYAVGYTVGHRVSGNKDNMKLSNFSAEACPTGTSIESDTSAIQIERGYYEGNTTAINFSGLSNHENVEVANTWFYGVTNAISGSTILSGVFRQNNVLNGAILDLATNFSNRMTIEIPTSMSHKNATPDLPSNYHLGDANNVEYIKQIYSEAGLTVRKGNIYSGPIPQNYSGTSGAPVSGEIPFCTCVFEDAALQINTKIEYRDTEFIAISVTINDVPYVAFAAAGVISAIANPGGFIVTATNNVGYYRINVSGFTGGTTFSGVVRIM